MFTIVNTHLTSRTLYILKKNQLLLTCEHSAFQLQLDSLRYTHCCPLQLFQQNQGKAISLLSSLLEQNISPTKQRIFLRLLWISHCLGTFHIKISLILQDRGLSQPDCQGFGFHSSQNSWKSRSICTRQYCIQPDTSETCRYEGCPSHPSHTRSRQPHSHRGLVSKWLIWDCKKPAVNSVPTSRSVLALGWGSTFTSQRTYKSQRVSDVNPTQYAWPNAKTKAAA